MEALTTIRHIFAWNTIFVPNEISAYSWETEFESNKSPKQVNLFLYKLENYVHSTAKSKYYFGDFLFEEHAEYKFGVISGHQLLTTIIIFLSALFARLSQIVVLSEVEIEIFQNIIKRRSIYPFSTVNNDNQLFKDYVINRIKKDKSGLETQSAKRIVDAFDFFTQKFNNKNEAYLRIMIDTIQRASCTTHCLKEEF